MKELFTHFVIRNIIKKQKMKAKRILLAGATGYLGRHIALQLPKTKFNNRLVVRNKQKASFDKQIYNVVEAEVTNPKTLKGIFKGIDTVISTIGITRQKDNLTYMDVDFQANVNLLEEAKKSGVKKFIYISVYNGEKLRNLKICKAKEKFVDYLKKSGMDYCIIRPNGFFSDMSDFLKMAKKGTVYLFGKGNLHINPIHGEDLAKVCIDAIEKEDKEIDVGGPDLLSHNEIAELAFKALKRDEKISHLPDWIRKLIIWTFRTFTSSKTYGPIEFFLSTMAIEMSAPKFGEKHLKDFFDESR